MKNVYRCISSLGTSWKGWRLRQEHLQLGKWISQACEPVANYFYTGLVQHCAEWGSRLPNCSNVLVNTTLKFPLSLKEKLYLNSDRCIFKIWDEGVVTVKQLVYYCKWQMLFNPQTHRREEQLLLREIFDSQMWLCLWCFVFLHRDYHIVISSSSELHYIKAPQMYWSSSWLYFSG